LNKQYDNTGALFRNEDKADEKDRDYSGTLDVEGIEYWVSGFVRVSRTGGKKFLALKVKRKIERPDTTRSRAEGLDDFVPF
jgi:hypothetical protein